MNKFFSLIVFIVAGNFSFAQTSQTLSARSFGAQLEKDTNKVLIDVRTPEEFKQGHLPHAENINWNDKDFVINVTDFYKNKNIYLYCLSGGRSTKAANLLSAKGYHVFELEGGLLKWREAQLPETKPENAVIDILTNGQFKHLINSGENVFIDFYAQWCTPCREMEPQLKEIETELNDKLKLLRIDADKNYGLMQSLKLAALPVIQFYQNGKLKWQYQGYISKARILKQLKKFGL